MLRRWLIEQAVKQAGRQVEAYRRQAHSPRRPAPVSGESESGREEEVGRTASEAPPETDSGELSPARAQVLVVFGLGVEADGLVRQLEGIRSTSGGAFVEHRGRLDDRDLVVLETGAGGDAAAAATRDALALYRPRWVVAAGFATGLREELGRGDLLMVDRVLASEGEELATGLRMESSDPMPRVYQGSLLSLARIPRSAKKKRQVSESSPALAFDLEGYAVADRCREAGCPCLIVKIVTETLGDEVPAELLHLAQQRSWAGRIGAAAGALWRRPGTLKVLWQQQEEGLKASRRLGRFLRGVLAQLPLEPDAPPDPSPGAST